MRHLILLALFSIQCHAGLWTGVAATQSGYPGTKGTIQSVSCRITIPAIPATPDTAVDLWCGIDGYGTKTVQQIGVAVYYTQGRQYIMLWWEMYPKKAVYVNTFQPQVGHTVALSVRSLGATRYELRAVNESTGQTFTTTSSNRQATGSSAAFIAERGSWPLPVYQSWFMDCRVNGQPLGTWDYDLLSGVGATVSSLTPDGLSFWTSYP